MRTYFSRGSETRRQAQNDCLASEGWWPCHLFKAFGGYQCFESADDFRTALRQR